MGKPGNIFLIKEILARRNALNIVFTPESLNIPYIGKKEENMRCGSEKFLEFGKLGGKSTEKIYMAI